MRAQLRQFTANILCPTCGALGIIVWENDNGRRSLVALPNGFYERILNKRPYGIELVCQHCGAAQRENED